VRPQRVDSFLLTPARRGIDSVKLPRPDVILAIRCDERQAAENRVRRSVAAFLVPENPCSSSCTQAGCPKPSRHAQRLDHIPPSACENVGAPPRSDQTLVSTTCSSAPRSCLYHSSRPHSSLPISSIRRSARRAMIPATPWSRRPSCAFAAYFQPLSAGGSIERFVCHVWASTHRITPRQRGFKACNSPRHPADCNALTFFWLGICVKDVRAFIEN